MGDQSGGNPRFKSAGSLWKSSWKGRVPFTEMCCIEGFDSDPQVAAALYLDFGGALPIVPANGFWLGAVVGVAVSPPGAAQTIAKNGSIANEGWTLTMSDAGDSATGVERVNFTFTVFGGAGAVATVTLNFPIALTLLEAQLGISKTYFRIFAWFLPPPDGGAFGSINLNVEGFLSSGSVALSAAYVNSAPSLRVGADSGGGPAITTPNCLHGLVGGDGVANGDDADMTLTAAAWRAQVALEHQIVAAPTTVLPGLVADNGWRANSPALPVAAAPNPLEPFVGAVDLVQIGKGLTVDCSQPSVFGGAFLP